MLIIERQNRLKELLAARGTWDVDLLESSGLVERTHGGVVWLGDKPAADAGGRPYAFHQRMGYKADAKTRIAKAAASLVKPGQTVLVDGGTTTFFLARELVGRSLQLVTNSLPIGNLFL